MSQARAPRPPLSLAWTLVAASLGFAMIQLDVTIVNVALPAIGRDLGSGLAGLQWVIDAYALVFAAFLLSAGFLADIFGARRVFLAGLVVFAATSAACGLARAAPALVAARGLQGLGAAAMLPSSLALLNHACAGNARLRVWAVGWWTAASSVAIASGPVLGGLLIGLAGWRSIFFVNLPLCLLGGLLMLRVAETPRHPKGRGFDLPGQILAVLALAGLTFAVIEAGPRGASDPLVLAFGLLAVAAGAGFVAVERRSPAPMLPGLLFKTSTMAIAMAYGAAANFTYYGIIFVLSLYVQRVLGYDAVGAGLVFIPLTATFIVGNILSGWVSNRSGARLPMVAGALVDALGFLLLLRLDAGSGMLRMLPAFVLMPVGMGFGIPAMTTVVLASADRQLSGVASAALNAVRQAGGVVGVAAFGALAGRQGGVVAGLHVSALIAAGLLVVVASLAGLGIRASRA